jgi:hypothetical protein
MNPEPHNEFVGVDEEGLYIDINLLHMQILTPL